MILSSSDVAALLAALGLTSSLFKPIPDLIGSLTAPLDGVVSAVDGITTGLGLPKLEDLPLIGTILEAEDPMRITNMYKSLSTTKTHVVDSSDPCHVEPYDPPPVLSQTFPPFDSAKANIFRYRQQQSVNLGSWFVHENWMTPSLFTCASGSQISEIDIASGWGNLTGARAVLERHWDTFITQDDFQYLASIGINTVRLPIGYWSLGPLYCQGTPFEDFASVYTNSWGRVIRAINWAGEAGIGVLVDLHGAVGSQNGQPHSGISDGKINLFGNPTNENLTVNVLTYLVQQLAAVTNVVGIQLLNEPNNDDSLPDFYNRVITTLRQVSPEAMNFPFYIHDAFNLGMYSGFVGSRKDFVVEDHHSYFVFGSDDSHDTIKQETDKVDGPVASDLSSAYKKTHKNLVVGEWSCALTPESLSKEKNPDSSREKFCQGQEQTYSNNSAGWHFWSYKTETCDSEDGWCFKNVVGNMLPPTFFSYNSTPATTPAKSLLLSRAVAEMKLPAMVEVLDQARNESSLWNVKLSDSDGSTASPPASPSGTFWKKSLASHQRFFSIHSRRAQSSQVLPPSLESLTSTERSIAKGYSDGFLTAKIFAQYGMSRLGFKDQYISDSIKELEGVVAAGTEQYYKSWFYRGLNDGEVIVGKTVNI